MRSPRTAACSKARRRRRGCDPGLDLPYPVGEFEVGPVEGVHRLRHQPLEPLLDLVHALDVRTVHIEVRQRLPGPGARQDLLGLGLHLGQQPVVFGPAVRVGLVEVQIGAVEVARPAGVALAAHRVGGVLDRGRVDIAHPVAQRCHRTGRGTGRGIQFLAERGRARRRELLEPAGAGFARPRPLGELGDEGLGGPRAPEQPRSRPRARDRQYPSRAAGTAPSRSATAAQSSSDSVGVTVKTSRTA